MPISFKKSVFKKLNIKNQIGMTLIEVAIAFFVLSIITLIMVQGVMMARKATDLNKAKTEAMAIINNEIEEIRLRNYSEIGIVDGNPDGEIVEQSIINGYTVTRKIDWVEGEYSYKQIEVSAKNDIMKAEVSVVTQVAPSFGEGGPPTAQYPPPRNLKIEYDFTVLILRSIGLNWEKPDTETPLDRYDIYRKKGSGSYSKRGSSNITRYSDSFIEFSVGKYSYYAIAVYQDGTESEPSNVVTTTR